jgi:hypothetical protein
MIQSSLHPQPSHLGIIRFEVTVAGESLLACLGGLLLPLPQQPVAET